MPLSVREALHSGLPTLPARVPKKLFCQVVHSKRFASRGSGYLSSLSDRPVMPENIHSSSRKGCFNWFTQALKNHFLQGLAFLLMVSTCQVAPLFSQAQSYRVTGSVADEQGSPLSGATVRWKEGSAAASTDEAGNFVILLPGLKGTLVASYTGFEEREARIDGTTAVRLQLRRSSNALNDVVVVGYGTQKKSDLTGAIVSIPEKDIKNYAVPNVSQLLTGKAAGVYVSSNSGQPGDVSVVRVRGFGTVNDNNPLYVVDGQLFDNINNLNPSDIQNIEVLKDASATAIYGSRGSNGVILVSTKRAKKGESVVSLDSYVGSKQSYRSPKMQNSNQYFDFIKTAYANTGQTLDPKFQQQYERGNNTDWWKAVNQDAVTQNYNVSISNGGEKSRSYFSMGYLNDNGAIINTKFSRFSLKLNNEYDLSSFLTVGINLGLARNLTKDAGGLPGFYFLLQADPFTPVINPLVDQSDPNYQYDKYAPTEWSYNPNPVSLLRLNDRQSNDFNLFGNVYARVKILKTLSYFVQFNAENDNNRFKSFAPVYHSLFSSLNLANMESKYLDQSQLTNNSGQSQNYVIEQRLNFVKIVGSHSFDVMGGMTYESNESESINAFKTNAPGNDDAFRVLDAATTGAQVSGGKLEKSILSYIARINYAYGDRYLATINFRADGSSVFADGHKWGYFPSFSLGWRISNETFFKNSGLARSFSSLKLRAGWGQIGNQRINSYAPVTLIGTALDRQYNFGTGYSQAYFPTNIGNRDIKWETSQGTNIGLDAGLFNERLSVSADYFIKKTDNMLLQVPLPAISGYPNFPYANAGSVENRGFELAASYRKTAGRFYYNVGGNLSFYKNKVTSLGNGGLPLYGAVSKTEIGGPMSRFYGYVWEGVFQNQKEIDDYVGPGGQKIQPLATPGDFKFADLDKNGVIDDKDRTYIGNPHPKLIFGFNVSASYLGFDLTAFFQGTQGNQLFNGLKNLSSPGQQNALADAYTKAWYKEGDQATYPKPSLKNDNNNYRTSTWWIENGSFIRLQNVQLGYTVPLTRLLKSARASSCRIYVSGQNLVTFTGYSGLDPEIGSASPLNLGYDGIRYPSSRTVMIGINAQF